MTTAPRTTVRTVAVVMVACALLGLALGLLWYAVAPRVLLQVRGGQAVPDTFQPDGFIAADVWYAILASVAGLLVAAIVLWRSRVSLLVVLLATVLGGLVGALVMWLVGTRLGYVDVAALTKAAADGDRFDAALRLRMPGAVLLWPSMSAAVVFVAALWEWWHGRHAETAEPTLDDAVLD